VLTAGVDSAVQYLVQAGALALGIAVYSVPWGRVRERIAERRRQVPPAPPEPSGGSPVPT
jgi:hypothetical protein